MPRDELEDARAPAAVMRPHSVPTSGLIARMVRKRQVRIDGGHDGKCSACKSASRFGLILPSMTKTPGAPSATHARTAPHRAISLETREGLPCYRPPCGGRRRGPQQVNISESVGVPLGIGRCLKYAGAHPQAFRQMYKIVQTNAVRPLQIPG
jgi:hypothetical protein